MAKKYRVLYYLNQFFGQIGGEEKAGIEPSYLENNIGPSNGFNDFISDIGEIIGTLICGDNYFNENKDKAIKFIMEVIKKQKPDVVVAGPAFNAGRYGMACAGVANAVIDEFNIPVVTGMYIENPGVDECKSKAYVISVANSAKGMRQALSAMASLTRKLLEGEKIGLPEKEGYIPQGKRLTVFSEEKGSTRAVKMLLARLNNEPFETELPMPVFDKVTPAIPIKNIANATIALVTSGGIVPHGNPDRVQSASAQKWAKYDIEGINELSSKYCTIHGGYDPVYANEKPDRVAPLDILKKFEKDNLIGKVYKYFYTTTGTGTSVGNARNFGVEIGKELKEAGVDGVILTST